MNANETPRLEELGGLIYSPQTEYPFGKLIRLGGVSTLIFEKAIEDGYQAGLSAAAAHAEQGGEVEVLTDRQFTALINQSLPSGLSARNQGIWRAYFIVGWTCFHLGLAELAS